MWILIRRFVFAYSAIFLAVMPVVQVAVTIYASLLMLMFVVVVKPMDNRTSQSLQFLNEAFILLAA
jgi:hypothetical protein